MYKVTVRMHFDAAHYLRDYNGRCENLHGHRYEVAVSLTSRELDSTGLAYDFTKLKGALKEHFINRYDHVCLNDVAPYTEINPSAENIARTMYEGMAEVVAGSPARLQSVTVWESPDSWATFSED